MAVQKVNTGIDITDDPAFGGATLKFRGISNYCGFEIEDPESGEGAAVVVSRADAIVLRDELTRFIGR